MEKYIKILYIISILIGIFGVFSGMEGESISLVLGGGFFMAFGLIIFVLNKK